jgi:hypothetical protein
MPEDTDNSDFLATARKRFEQDVSDEQELRKEALIDLRFEAGDQWEAGQKADRIKNGRPALTFNRTHTFVQQVSNEARENKPQIKFVPAEDSDEETAEIYEGLARHIQYDSDAAEAYETAAEQAAAGGFGYFRFLTEYCDDESDDLDVKVVPVPDQFAVYGVLMAAMYNMKPNHAFVVEEIPIADYEQMFPDSTIAQDGWDQAVKGCSGWVGTETVRVAEYWTLEEKSETRKSKTGRERKVTKRTVKFVKTNGFEILEKTDWPGYCIPIVPVLGKKRFIDGKPVLYSVIRFQRDPQRLINYYKTRIAETLGTAPIQPYMVAQGQIPNDIRGQWETLNTRLAPYLEYKPVDVDGRPAPPPMRQVFEAPIASLSAAAQQEIDDMKATTGIYDASLGNKSNENSGIAIQRRQQQSDITNLHFMDNLERGFKKGGTILADLIPKVYDAPRIVRILGHDEEPKLVKINQDFQNKHGESKSYKIGGDGVAKYDVVVTMGRAFSSKRQESFDMMTQLVQGNPELIANIGDIMFRNSDVAGSDELADRFKKMLPPQLQDPQDGQPEIPPQVQAQMQQLQQQHQALNAYAQQVEKENEQYKAGAQVKEAEIAAKVEIEHGRMQLEREKMQIQLAIAEITAKAQDSRERMKLEYTLNKELAVQDDAQAHEAAMAAADAGHQERMASVQAEHQAAATDQQAEHQFNANEQQAGHAKEQAKLAAKAKPKAKE